MKNAPSQPSHCGRAYGPWGLTAPLCLLCLAAVYVPTLPAQVIFDNTYPNLNPLYNWGVYYEHVYKQVREGTWKPGDDWWGIETGVVDLSPYGEMVPNNVRQKVDAMKAAMKAKEFIVFKGPLTKQDGSPAAQPGQTLTDKEMLSMDYFIEGVIGNIPK